MIPLDRRSPDRHPVDLPVYIRYGRRRFLAARARDLSSDGMTLAVRSLTLPAGTPVELELRGGGRTWLLPAVVIRGGNNGIGVSFRDSQLELLRGLTQPAAAGLPPLAAGVAIPPRP